MAFSPGTSFFSCQHHSIFLSSSLCCSYQKDRWAKPGNLAKCKSYIEDAIAWHDRLCGLVVRVSGYRYRGPGFDPRRYQVFWVVVGLERVHSASWASWGQLRSYLNEKSSGSRFRKQRITAVGIRCADHVTPLYPRKLALTSPTGGGRSVGIVRVRTKATEFSLYLQNLCKIPSTSSLWCAILCWKVGWF